MKPRLGMLGAPNPPWVGQSVHYYSGDFPLNWHHNQRMFQTGEETFVGPFSATIVRVHPSGLVNLRVDYPSLLRCSDQMSEIVESVAEVEKPVGRGWVWID